MKTTIRSLTVPLALLTLSLTAPRALAEPMPDDPSVLDAFTSQMMGVWTATDDRGGPIGFVIQKDLAQTPVLGADGASRAGSVHLVAPCLLSIAVRDRERPQAFRLALAREDHDLIHTVAADTSTTAGKGALVGVERDGVTYVCGADQVAVIDAKGTCRHYALDAAKAADKAPPGSWWRRSEGSCTWRDGVLRGLMKSEFRLERRGSALVTAGAPATTLRRQPSLQAAGATIQGRPARLGPIFEEPLEGGAPTPGANQIVFGTGGSNTDWRLLLGRVESSAPDGLVRVAAGARTLWTRVGLVHRGSADGLAPGDAVHVVTEDDDRVGRYLGPADGGRHRVRLERAFGRTQDEELSPASLLAINDRVIAPGTIVRWERERVDGKASWWSGTVAAVRGDSAWVFRMNAAMTRVPLAQLRVISMKPLKVGDRVVVHRGAHSDESGARPGTVKKVSDPMGLGYGVAFDDKPAIDYPVELGEIDRL